MSRRRFLALFSWACVVASASLLLSPAVFHAAPQSSGYRIIRNVPLNSDGQYDYVTVDPEARLVYVPRNTHIQVIHADSGKIVADIPDMSGLHGVDVAPEFNRGFVTGNEGTPPPTGGGPPIAVIYLLDTKAMKVSGKLTPAGAKGADGLIYDSATKRAFINMGASNNVEVVDGATGQLVGTVTLPGRPEIASPDGKGSVFVNIVDKNLVVEYDGKSLAIKNTWPVPCDRPYGNAIDRTHRLLFIGCRGKLNTLESDNKMVVMSA